MTLIEVEPQPRIDTEVRLAGGGEARRTEYTGTAWFDGKPYVSGPVMQRSRSAPRGLRNATFEAGFFLPDSLAYDRAALGEATLTLSVTLQAAGDTGAVIDTAATFADDPSGAPTWIHVWLRAHIGWPAGVGYRVIALTPPEAVR
jgi:hypothetical protein